MIRHHGLAAFRAILTGLAVSAALTVSVLAQTRDTGFDPPRIANSLSVGLIQQDDSDCLNTTVRDDPNRMLGGEIWITRNRDGTATVKVGMTGTPNTVYQFNLKCVRLLGDILTDDEGSGIATFSFRLSEVGPKFAFDMYPPGGPSGNKFQSLTATMP